MRALYTIGHSNLELAAFLKTLKQHKVAAVVDVRSVPRSRWVPHFSQPNLHESLRKAGIDYIFLGAELGGRPTDPAAYRTDGRVNYRARRQAADFKAGIARVRQESNSHAVALMCAEEDPLECHRFMLIVPALVTSRLEILHIRRGGTIETQSEAEDRLLEAVKPGDSQTGALFTEDRNAALEIAYEERAAEYAYRKKPSASPRKKSRAVAR